MPEISNTTLRHVTIHTDGSCLGNPGPGGYGAIVEFRGQEKELSGGFRRTTNNRMEILAVIAGLEVLKERCSVTVYSDSRYVVDAVEKGWARKMESQRLDAKQARGGSKPRSVGTGCFLPWSRHEVEIPSGSAATQVTPATFERTSTQSQPTTARTCRMTMDSRIHERDSYDHAIGTGIRSPISTSRAAPK